MERPDDDPLPEWGALVLAQARPPLRRALTGILHFDTRLSRIVTAAQEPALAQIRLAWWREELGRPLGETSSAPADPLLAALRSEFAGDTATLVSLVDGWEGLLETEPWPEAVLAEFVDAHGDVFAALAKLCGHEGHVREAAAHGRCWATAKLALLADATAHKPPPGLPALPRNLRPLAIIGGLSRRAILRGGAPLFGDRFSPLAALRLGIFGR